MIRRLLPLLLCLASLLPGGAGAEGLRVGVLLSGAGTAYWAVMEGLREHLDEGDIAGEPEVVTLASAEPGAKTLEGLAAMDVVVAVGTRASRASRALPARVPVLSVFLPHTAYRQVAASAAPARRRSAVFLEQPLPRQFAFLRALLPETRVVGVLLGPASAYREDELRTAAEAAGLRLEVARVEDDQEPVAAMKALVRAADAVLAVPDATVLTPNRAKWLLYMAYRRNTPVVGFSEPYVEAGALAALHATPRQIGRQAAERLRRFRDSGALGPPAFPRYFSIALNRFTARSLGIALPEEDELRKVVAGAGEEAR